MKLLLKIFFGKNSLPLFVVIFFAILAGRSLVFQSGYFNMHDDLQLMRQLMMEKCFLDGQIPCRWVPDMGYGFGFPLFNFYPPLPYLIGEIFRFFGLTFITTVKLTFALSFLISGIGMYFLAKEFFGVIGGVMSSVFYVWAPYHAVDVYVRGAMNEAWALAFFPIIFWSAYKLIKSEKTKMFKWMLVLTLSYFALFTSHNLMLLIFTPFFGVWVLIHLWRENSWGRLPWLIISGVWALGLSSFFTFPALLENKFTQVKSQLVGYYDYTAHFVSVRQLFFSRFWGYGPSVWVEAEDGMSFQIGHLHWILAILVGILLILRGVKAIREKSLKKDVILQVTGYLFVVGWISSYMTHLKSIWIYQALPQLGYIQFSWRFLTLVIFSFSFVVGAIPGILANWKSKRGFLAKLFVTPGQMFITLILIILLLVLNWNYFRPEHGKMGALTDKEKFSGAAWDLQQTAGIYDYLPVWAKTAPKSAASVAAELMGGSGIVTGMEQGTYYSKFNAKIESEEAQVRLSTFYFPGWRVFVKEGTNNKEIPTFIPDEEMWGRMWIVLPKGEHLVYAQLFNTPVRTWANLISLTSWGFFIFLPLWKRRSA